MVLAVSREYLNRQRDEEHDPPLVAVGQICSTLSMTHNLAQCRHVIQKAVAAGAKAVFFPEASDYMSESTEEAISLCKPVDKSPFVLGLQEDAQKNYLPISVGVHEPSDNPDSKRIKNTVLWIDEKGKIAQRYQKLHMFDIELEGRPPIKESDFIEPGNEILSPFETVIGKIGAAICFDLRFPELALALKRQKADVIIYPSAFTVPTGRAHWMSLLRARAIECQVYIIAAAQVGAHNEKRSSYGHSVVIDPWGEIVAELGGEKKDEPEVIIAKIDPERLNWTRKQIPLPRRTDVYAKV